MRKRKLAAKLMALSLVLSGLPVTSVHGAELPDVTDGVQQDAEGKENTDPDPVESADHKEAADTKEADTEGVNSEETAPAESGDSVEQKEETQETAEDSNKEETEEETVDGAEQISLQTEKTKSKVSENEKMAGSNGVLYDDVAYLSARNVLAMDEQSQEVYRALCDEIASYKEGGLEVEDVVLAVDSDGDLYYSYYVPMRALEEIEAEFLPEDNGILTPASENNGDSETSDESQNAGEEDKKDDDASDGSQGADGEDKKDDDASDGSQNAGEEDKKDDDTSDESQNAGGEDKKDEGTSGESQNDKEEETKEDDTANENQDDGEDKKDDSTADEKENGEEEIKEDEETSDELETDDPDEEQENQEAVLEEQEAEEDEYVLFEENMDAIPDVQEETFAVIDPVRVENTIDLGYGDGEGDGLNWSGKEFRAWLPQDDYFTKQLNATQKKYYKAATEKLLGGSNAFSFQESLSSTSTVGNNVAHVISALILTYPDRTDWIAKPGGFKGSVKYKKGARTGTYTFTVDKSDYYSESLEAEAAQMVQEVGQQAQQYAAENYPNAPVYGVVKYCDQWVCANGYYEMAGTRDPSSAAEKEQYYNCHSTYGILLKGYGVCESYAKTMSRLLDAVGIPNVYAVGMAGTPGNLGGHAWNYVQMPDGKWYLQDSTWNDTTNQADTNSSMAYLLAAEDGRHLESGCNYVNESPDFEFPERSSSKYNVTSFQLSEVQRDLVAKETMTLTCLPQTSGTWTSSNPKVAKVDAKGKVTAVAGGTAQITFAGSGVTAACTVNVDQVKAVKTEDTKKTSETVSLGIGEGVKGSRDIVLSVDMGTSPHTAGWMIQHGKEASPTVKPTKDTGAASVSAKVEDNRITVHVAALKEGSMSVPVKFGGKTVTLNVSVGKIITSEMFDVTWPSEVKEGADGSRTAVYSGKVIKPTVKKKSDAAYKQVTFKTTYINNKDAGTAKVLITGTGKYGGTIEYPFTITPVDITSADFSKSLNSKAYNGGANPPTTTVKLDKKTLKAGKDYEILYTGNGAVKEALDVVPAGSYTITIRGIGNYTGEASRTQSYQVTQNTIAKVTVAGSGNAKQTGVPQKPFTPKIGKNMLPETDYKIVWYKGQGKTMSSAPMSTAPVVKGKYTAVITVQGPNLTTTASKKEIKKSFTIK